MTFPEDRERRLEGSSFENDGREATDAELASAEARLQSLPLEDLVPLQAEWIEAVVAKAIAVRLPATTPLAEVGGQPVWLRIRRWAVAAAALVGIQSAAVAMTVTTVGVVAVTATVLIWKSGRNSNATMSFAMAVEILLRADQSDDDRAAALRQVARRAQALIELLRVVRQEAGVPALAQAAGSAIGMMRGLLDGEIPATIPALDDTFDAAWSILQDRRVDAPLRQLHLSKCLTMMDAGLAAVHAMPACSDELAANRTVQLRRLRAMSNP